VFAFVEALYLFSVSLEKLLAFFFLAHLWHFICNILQASKDRCNTKRKRERENAEFITINY